MSESLDNKKKHSVIEDEGWTDRDHYFKVKKKKLDEQWQGPGSAASSNQYKKGSSTDKSEISMIFEGLIMNIDGHTEPSSVILIGLITKHGGSYRQYFDSTVTHLLACQLAHSKLKELVKRKNPPHIVHPRWIMDCVKSGVLLSVKDYLIVDNSRNTIQHKDMRSFTTVNRNNVVNQQQFISVESGSSSIGNSRTSPSSSSSNQPEKKEEYNFALSPSTTTVGKSTLRIKKKTSTPSVLPTIENIVTPPLLETNKTFNKQQFIIPERRAPTNNPTTSISEKNQNVVEEVRPVKDFMAKSAASDPNFINNYMKSSRLHFISTWKNKQRSKNPTSSTADKKGVFVVHIDMDCFFASIAMRDNPSLRNKPIAVSYSTDGTGDISSANYCARDFGVRAGMWMKQARELCPDLIVVPYEFEKYNEAASKVDEILNNHCERVKIISIDEAFIEITNELKNNTVEELNELVSNIRNEIEKETQCTASAGMSTNQLLARIATKKAKPNGQFYLDSKDAINFIENLNIEEIPSVGWKTKKFFNQMSITKCSQLLNYSKSELKELVGEKKGETLYNFIRGIDKRPFFDDTGRKSVGVEVNYGIRFTKIAEVSEFIDKLALEVSNRLKNENVKGKAIVLKVKKRKDEAPEAKKYLGHGICDNFSKSCTVPYFTDDSDLISRKVKDLYNQLSIDAEDLRGIAIQIQKLNVTRNNNNSSLTKYLKKDVQQIEQQVEALNSQNDNICIADINNETEDLVIQPRDIYEAKTTNTTEKRAAQKKKEKHAFRLDEFCELENLAKNGLNEPISFSFIEEMPWDIKRDIIKDLTWKKKQQEQKEKEKHKQESENNGDIVNTVEEVTFPYLFNSIHLEDMTYVKEIITDWYEENSDDFYSDPDVANLFVEIIIQILKSYVDNLDLISARKLIKFIRNLLVKEPSNQDVIDKDRLTLATDLTNTITQAFQNEIIEVEFPNCMFSL